MIDLRKIKEEFWQRHSNPWSGLTRMFIAPFLYLAIWYHSWIGLGLVILWTIVNPFIFPKPKKTENWFTYVVLGEEMWLENFAKKPKLDLALTLNIITAASFIPSIYFAYVNMFWPTLYFGTLMYISKLWYVDRVALEYKYEKLVNARAS